VVEKLTILPVVKETQEEPDLVEIFRQQVGDGLFKIWPQKPLDPVNTRWSNTPMEK